MGEEDRWAKHETIISARFLKGLDRFGVNYRRCKASFADSGIFTMKKTLLSLFTCGFVSLVYPLTAADPVAHQVQDKVVLVSVAEAGKQFGWEPKLEGDTLVLCRDELCVPVDLNQVAHQKSKDGLFVDAETLGKIMDFSFQVADKQVNLHPGRDAVAESSSYHSSWPEGRGFKHGQTLPDIPLIDLEGNEVRFGDFLGKRYLIYGWASW